MRSWGILGAGLVGLLAGFGLGTHWPAVPPNDPSGAAKTGSPPGNGIVDPEDAYLNAVGFRDELRAGAPVDSLLAPGSFWRRTMRVLRHDSTGLEAVAMPRPGRGGNYYLLRGDSITLLREDLRKVR